MSTNASLEKPTLRALSLHWRFLIPLIVVMALTFAVVGLSTFTLVRDAEEASVRDIHESFGDRMVDVLEGLVVDFQTAILFLNFQSNAGIEANPQILNLVQGIAPEISQIVRVDAAGEIIAESGMNDELLQGAADIPSTSWFAAVQATSPYRSNFIARDDGESGYLIGAVRGFDGSVTAVLIEASDIYDLVNNTALPDEGRSYAVLNDGTILTHADVPGLAGTALDRGEALDVITVSHEAPVYLGEITNFQGEKVVASVYSMSFTGANIVIETPSETAFATSRLAATLFFAAFVLAGLITSAAGMVVFGRTVSSPLRRLLHGTADIATGKLDARVELSRRDEMGTLATAFNQMAISLQERDARLHEQNTALQKANLELSEANRLKDEFLATMSHELRTPLNAITGYTSIMLSGMGVSLGDTEHGMVQEIAAGSARLTELITDILEISRLQAGRTEIVPDVVDLYQLAEGWLTALNVLAAQKGIALQYQVSSDVPRQVEIDPDALTKIATNLLSNGIKFTDDGYVRLEVRRTNDHLVLEVSDTGYGIPKHAQEYIFEEFRQVDASYKRTAGGSGLGLAIVNRLTRLMGGTVSLESTPKLGSTFTVRVPLVHAQQPLEATVYDART